MSRIAYAAPLALLLVACGSPTREAPAPPPITASAPSPSPSASPGPAEIATPETQRAAELERVTEKSLPVRPIATPMPEPSGDPNVPPPATIATPPPSASPDPLRAMQDSQARREDYQRRLASLQTALEDARADVAKRQKDLLAFKNPFLPRPVLAPDEAQAISGMDGAARAKWAEEKLAEANAAFEAAQKSYDDAKANPPLN
ncbi:MAG TPA: hypothetical protein VMT33_04510 [Candidatus Bathyarchaeia archaeon]|nr:hypothetical protein [Candidatus Bathyarchaeia archaeon]